MPLEDGLPRLKLSYISAPFVLGNPLPPCTDLEVEDGRPFEDVMTGDVVLFNDVVLGLFTID